MPRIGEVRKFISPEDLKALTKASDAIKEAGGDEEKKQEMIEARKLVKEQISVNVEREIYRRAEEFGRLLLELVEKYGYAPWDDLRNACRERGDYFVDRLKQDERYSIVATMIGGLTEEQREIFGNILNDVELSIRARNNVIDFAQQEIRNRKYGRGLTMSDREHYDEASDDELGAIIFRSCNTRSNPKFSSPVGKVRLYRTNKFCVQLSVEEQEDVQTLHGPQDDISNKDTQSGKKMLGGFMARIKRFCNPETGKLIDATALIVAYNPTSEILQDYDSIEKIEEHERGHLLNYIVQSSFRPHSEKIPERQHISEYRDIRHGIIELPVIEKAYSQSADKENQLQEYRRHLSRLKRYFFEKTRDELLADYRARGNFSYIRNLVIPEDEKSINVFCYYYDNEFVGRIANIPPQLIREIRKSQEEYLQAITRQVAAAERVLMIIDQLPKSAQLKGQFYAILQDTALYNWEDRLNYLYREEVAPTSVAIEKQAQGQAASQQRSPRLLFAKIAERFKRPRK
ncbi:MAG: hypothetical protein V1905_03380 [bacterium]